MTGTDHQYAPSKTTPLISVSHPTRYTKPPIDVDYGFMHSGELPSTNNKNDVVLSNLTYTPDVHHTKRLIHAVEKTRTKSLLNDHDDEERLSIFKDKPPPQKGEYYILGDLDESISDTYYLCPLQINMKEREKPFERKIPSVKLSILPDERSVNEHNLTNSNDRLMRSATSIKKV
mgnify:CR=1 FL=1|tara:strand:- start:21947 stop:22471 length:525 start_codon:yes stop_codon:yes gene_type:complete